jgi:hypothetical protein
VTDIKYIIVSGDDVDFFLRLLLGISHLTSANVFMAAFVMM